MPRIVKPLVSTNIKKYKPKEKTYTKSDGQGLQLLIKPNGTKLWEFYFFSPIFLKRRKTTFGVYNSQTNTLKMARDKRADYLKLVADGIDPMEYYSEQKKIKKMEAEKDTVTVQEVLNDFYSHRTKTHRLKEITVSKDKSRVENHFINKLPKKDKTNILDVTYDVTIKILKKLEKDDKLETLRKVKAILVNMLNYAYAENIIKDNLIIGRLQVYNFVTPTKARNNPTLTKKEDIKHFYNAILNYKKNLVSKYLLLMSIHTAQRQGAIIKAKWSDIDFDNKIWIIPKEHMKGTATATKDHYLPLSDELIVYLQELKFYTGESEYLFPNSQQKATRNKYPHISNNTARSTIRALGFSNEQQTAHGLRAMFKTVCKEHQEEHKLSNEFVERILAHKIGNDVENAYNRANSLEDMRKVITWWSKFLEGLKNE